MKTAILLFAGMMSSAAFAANSTKGISLLNALQEAETASPRLKSTKMREESARQNVKVNQSGYYPDLSAAGVASTGDPGSFSMFDVDNNIAAAHRIGAGGALVLKQDVWDFGRTSNAVDTAKAEQALTEKEYYMDRADVAREVLRTYLNCSYLKAQVDNSKEIVDEAHLLAVETNKFVRSGQRSVVERDLVDAESKEAETHMQEFMERVKEVERRLGLQMGRAGSVVCRGVHEVESGLRALERKSGPAPMIEAEKQRVQIAKSRLEQARSENWPILFGAATAGYWDDPTVRDRMNYAAGIGVTLPLFEGFRISSEIDREAASLGAEQHTLSDANLELDKANSRYDEQIQSLIVRTNFLDKEYKLARQTFNLAKHRYVTLQGNMIDLREAIRNLDRVLQERDLTDRDLYEARGEKALVNGGYYHN